MAPDNKAGKKGSREGKSGTSEFSSISPEAREDLNRMVASDEFAEALFDPDEVTMGDLTRLVDRSDFEAEGVTLMMFSRYVLVTE